MQIKPLLLLAALLAVLCPVTTPAAVGGGGIFIPGGGVTTEQVTNISTYIANIVGGATNGIPKLDGIGTNTTLINQTNLGDVVLNVFPLASDPIRLKQYEWSGTFSLGEGNTTGTHDNQITIGNDNVHQSTAGAVLGWGNENHAEDGFVFGGNNYVDPVVNALISGWANKAYGTGTDVMLLGVSNLSSNANTFAIGNNNLVRADHAGVIGTTLTNGSTGSVDIGLTDTTKTTFRTNQVLFRVPIHGDASGVSNAVTLVAGSNTTITTNANGREFTIASTGGGSGSNGISYAEISWPAVGTTGNEETWLKYTNGVKAVTVINAGGNSKLVITNIAGEQMADFDINGYIALDITEYDGTPVLTKANNIRVLADGNGTAAIDFSSATGIQINGIVLNTPSWDIGEFLWIDGSGQVSGTSNLPLASLTVTGNAVVEGQVIGNGQGITNLIYAPNTVTLFETNAAILTNCVSFLNVTNHVRFTNWASVAVAGQWFNVFLTNSTGNNYYIDVPTNGFTRNMTNSTGSYVVADASGTNFACLLTNGQRARLVGEFVGGNLNAATFYFRHW